MSRRLLAPAALGLLLLCAAVRLGTLQGWLAPVRVAGASMAETLYGDHLLLRCDDCAFPCRFDAEDLPADERIVCPNCGRLHRGLSDAQPHRGERVLVDRLPYLLHAPQRWDVVAFRQEEYEHPLAVKRILGLPGERIQLRGGDVFVEGKIQRKSLAQLRSLAILVHDNAYQVPADRGLPPRWVVGPDVTGAGSWGGLTYQHWRCFDGPLRRVPAAITDDYGFNQNERRQLQPVTDLLLVLRASLQSGPRTLAVGWHDGRERFEASLQFGEGTVVLRRDGRPVRSAALPAAAYARGVKVEFAVCDQRVSLAIDENLLIQYDYTPIIHEGSSFRQPPSFLVDMKPAGVAIDRLRLLRDIYYLDPVGLDRDWSAHQPLARDEYFVVGDNVPRSRDSRHTPGHGVSGRALLGRVRSFR